MPEDGLHRLTRLKVNLDRRALILNAIRAFFHRQGFLEVETPLRVPGVAPEQFIIPFTADGWFLSTSPELQMKQLLAAGYEKIFQICHCFRKEEHGKQHNPEFTILEWYRTGADYNKIIDDTEGLVLHAARVLGMSSLIHYQGKDIDITAPWPKVTVSESFLRSAGWDPVTDFDPERFDIDLVEKVALAFSKTRPTVLTDYPASCASLARLKPGNPLVAERAEVFIGGLEIANVYSELNNAGEQAQRFRLEIEQMGREGKTASMPERFLKAVKYLPQCGGIALGVDRLVMLFCDATSLDEVMAFPADAL